MRNTYSLLLSEKLRVIAEEKHQYHPLTERHIQALWLEQKYFKSLTTENNDRIEIISPGIWNAEAGPDFLKALIRINGQEMKGDIEIHLSEEDWYHHKHHLDERYNNVILHVAFWKPRHIMELTTKEGRQILQIHLENSLLIPQQKIVQIIDLDLYPYKQFLGSGRCAQKIFQTLDEGSVEKFFTHAAQWRLSQKRNFLKAHATDSSQLMQLGMAMSLGFKHNIDPFIQMFLSCQRYLDCTEDQLLAICLKACGFFAPDYVLQWNDSKKYQQLMNEAVKFPISDFPLLKMRTHQIRPLNHPIRRLAILAKILKDYRYRNFKQELQTIWNDNWKSRKWSSLRKLLLEAMPSYEDEYWSSHFLFETSPQRNPVPLVGKEFKLTYIVNVFLPLLQEAIEEKADLTEWRALAEFYSTFPPGNSGKAKYIIHRLFGDTPKGQILKRGDMEQGAFQLHKDFCIHYESSCEGCPFIQRFERLSHCYGL